jgi:hypothetical protein
MTREQSAEQYITILSSKTVDGQPIYPQAVLQNIIERPEYLLSALELQQRADSYIIKLGGAFGISDLSPAEIQRTLTDQSLQSLSARIQEETTEGKNPKVFVALAGPGGAGKDSVFENTQEHLDADGKHVTRVFKYTTRDAGRAGAYHFATGIEDLHMQVGDLPVTSEEGAEIEKVFGFAVEENRLTLENLLKIQSMVDSKDSLEEWNIRLDNEKTSFVEFLYRKNRGWYATDGNEIVEGLKESDLSVITGNPQNLAKMVEWVSRTHPEIIPLMVYVLPAYPSQFTSAARALARDGVEQDTKALMSTTGPRQTDEMGMFVDLVTSNALDPKNVVILENDVLLSDPHVSGKIETLAGKQLADALLNH